MTFVRNGLPNYDTDAASLASGIVFTEPSMTQQQFKEETDINTIARRFGITGQLPAPAKLPEYGDFCGISDYQSALNAVMAADQAFLTLPSQVRERFANNPQGLLDFVADPANREEAIKIGLLEAPEPTPVPTPSPPPSSAF